MQQRVRRVSFPHPFCSTAPTILVRSRPQQPPPHLHRNQPIKRHMHHRQRRLRPQQRLHHIPHPRRHHPQRRRRHQRRLHQIKHTQPTLRALNLTHRPTHPLQRHLD